jgi:hypothetical protein
MDKRSIQQNKAMHLWAEQWSVMLNQGGHTVRQTLKEDWDTMWSKYLFKELIIKKLAKAMFDKESTTELTSKEINQIVDIVSKNLSNYGYIPFPDIEELRDYTNKQCL